MYFQDTKDWGTAYIHLWDGDKTTNLPVQMEKLADNIYKYDAGTCTGGLFIKQGSFDGNQSTDIPFSGDAYYKLLDTQTDGKWNWEKIQDITDVAAFEAQFVSKDITFHYDAKSLNSDAKLISLTPEEKTTGSNELYLIGGPAKNSWEYPDRDNFIPMNQLGNKFYLLNVDFNSSDADSYFKFSTAKENWTFYGPQSTDDDQQLAADGKATDMGVNYAKSFKVPGGHYDVVVEFTAADQLHVQMFPANTYGNTTIDGTVDRNIVTFTYTSIDKNVRLVDGGKVYEVNSVNEGAVYYIIGTRFIRAADKLVTVPAPAIYQNEGITMTTETPGALIYYTLDGTEPTTDSYLYQAALTLPAKSTTYKAFTIHAGMKNSDIAVYDYIVPVVTKVSEFDFLGSSNSWWEPANAAVANIAALSDDTDWTADGAEHNNLHYGKVVLDNVVIDFSKATPDSKEVARLTPEGVKVPAGVTMHIYSRIDGWELSSIEFTGDNNFTANAGAFDGGRWTAKADAQTLAEGDAEAPLTEVIMTANAANNGFTGVKVTLAENEAAKAPKTTGVRDIISGDDNNAPVEYYNLQGIRVANPEAGNLYIKRQGAKSTKVVF